MSKSIDPNSILSVYKTLKTSATNVNTINTLKRNSLIMNGFVTVDSANASNNDEKEQNELMRSLEVAFDEDEDHDEEEEPTYHHHYYQPRPVAVPPSSSYQRHADAESTHKDTFSRRETVEKIDRPTPTLSTSTAVSSSASTNATVTTVQSNLHHHHHQPGRSNLKGQGRGARDKRLSVAPKRLSLTGTAQSSHGRKLFLTKKYLVQMELVERFIWDYKQDYNLMDEHLKASENMHISEQLHRLLM